MRLSLSKSLVVVAIVAVASYAVYVRMMMPGGPPAWGNMGPKPVDVAQVLSRNVQQWHEYSGRLTAVDQVEIRPRVTGTIDAVHFQNGVMVKRGDRLFTIDPRPYKAVLQSALAHAALAEANLERAKMLMKDKAISQRDYDQRENAAEVARAELETAKLNLQYTDIRAPVTGRVGRSEITQGNLVQAGANAPILTSIVSVHPIYVDFEMDEATYLQYVTLNATEVEAIADAPVILALGGSDDFMHAGRVEAFDNHLNENSGTIRVRAIFDNKKGGLVPGLFARVRIGDAAIGESILVAERAIGTDQDKRFVLVVDADNKVHYRQVALGAIVDGFRVIYSGLAADDRIILNGLQRARPGTEVVPQLVEMTARPIPKTMPSAAGGGK